MAMTTTKNANPEYHVDGRVSIALDALSDEQRRAVSSVLIDREHFVASIADRRRVEKISRSEPVYALVMPSGLNIIYEVRGEQIQVLDLMAKATLARYGPKKRTRSHSRATKKPNGAGGSM